MRYHCAFCKNPLHPLNTWKADDDLFFCNEFCADAADDTARMIAEQQLACEEARAA